MIFGSVWRAYLLTYVATYIPTYLLTYALTYLLTYMLTYLHTYVLQFRASLLYTQRNITYTKQHIHTQSNMATRMTKYNPRNITYNESARQQFNISPPLRGGGGWLLVWCWDQKNPEFLHILTNSDPPLTSHLTPSRPALSAPVLS